MEWYDLWQHEPYKTVELINSKTTTEKLELVVALAEEIISEEKNIKSFIENDEHVKRLYPLIKDIVSIGKTTDFPELLWIEQMNQAHDDIEKMKERGYVF